MLTIPTLPRWATGGSADVSEPPDATKDTGWVAKIRPPHEWFNWLGLLTYNALNYVFARVRQYTSLDALAAAVGVGDTAELMEDDSAHLPGSQISSFSSGATVHDIAADGAYVYVAHANSCTKYTRAGVASGVTFTPSTADTIVRVVTNGEVVLLAYGTRVQAFEASTGVSRWIVDHGATVRDVALDATRAYLVGDPDTSAGANITLRAIYLSSGATNWTHAHGDNTTTVYSVATDGRMVFIAGDARPTGSGANLRGINASNGRDATGESGVADTDELSWNAVTATDVISPGCLAVDEGRLFVAYQSAVSLESRSKLTGEVLRSVTPPSSMVAQRVSLDQDWVVVGSSVTGDVAVAFTKPDLAAGWRFNSTGGARVATDGAAVFASTGSTVSRVARGNGAERRLRITPATALGARFRWLALPAR